MHRFLAGTGSPASPIQLHSCCRCTRGRDWKCTFSFPCAIFLCTICIILYEYQSSDIDASILAGSCEIITWLPCVLQVCVRVRDSANLSTMSVDGIITRLREEIAAFKWEWCSMNFFPPVIDSICDFGGVCSDEQHLILGVTILVSVVEMLKTDVLS